MCAFNRSQSCRHFLLFEVLIAILILTSFMLPIIKLPILHFQKQVDHLSQFEKRRIADWTFSEVKELLLKESIPLHKLPQKREEPVSFPLSEVLLEIPSLRSKKISRSFTLKCTGEKEGLKGETYRIYKMVIELDGEKIKPPYRLIITFLNN